ncbi:MAG: FHA domain-containing protein, partial [Deltaproteobacteria bacterium]|nr:FHA domain-containing protein [Deltaproteobacteria bacterium]
PDNATVLVYDHTTTGGKAAEAASGDITLEKPIPLPKADPKTSDTISPSGVKSLPISGRTAGTVVGALMALGILSPSTAHAAIGGVSDLVQQHGHSGMTGMVVGLGAAMLGMAFFGRGGKGETSIPKAQTGGNLQTEQGKAIVPHPDGSYFVVGRNPESHLQIMDPALSGAHSTFFKASDGNWYVANGTVDPASGSLVKKSLNGVTANGKRVESFAPIKDGDRIGLPGKDGKTYELVFRDPAKLPAVLPPPPPPPPPAKAAVELQGVPVPVHQGNAITADGQSLHIFPHRENLKDTQLFDYKDRYGQIKSVHYLPGTTDLVITFSVQDRSPQGPKNFPDLQVKMSANDAQAQGIMHGNQVSAGEFKLIPTEPEHPYNVIPFKQGKGELVALAPHDVGQVLSAQLFTARPQNVHYDPATRQVMVHFDVGLTGDKHHTVKMPEAQALSLGLLKAVGGELKVNSKTLSFEGHHYDPFDPMGTKIKAPEMPAAAFSPSKTPEPSPAKVVIEPPSDPNMGKHWFNKTEDKGGIAAGSNKGVVEEGKANEDRYAFAVYPNGKTLLMAIDGMGGQIGGENAAEVARQGMQKAADEGKSPEEVLKAGHDAVYRYNQEHGFVKADGKIKQEAPGAVAVAVELTPKADGTYDARFVSVSDSAGVIIRLGDENPIVHYTERPTDYSQARKQIEGAPYLLTPDGRLARGQTLTFRKDPVANIVLAGLGIHFKTDQSSPDRPVKKGDIVIVGSDGLFENFGSYDTIHLIIQRSGAKTATEIRDVLINESLVRMYLLKNYKGQALTHEAYVYAYKQAVGKEPPKAWRGLYEPFTDANGNFHSYKMSDNGKTVIHVQSGTEVDTFKSDNVTAVVQIVGEPITGGKAEEKQAKPAPAGPAPIGDLAKTKLSEGVQPPPLLDQTPTAAKNPDFTSRLDPTFTPTQGGVAHQWYATVDPSIPGSVRVSVTQAGERRVHAPLGPNQTWVETSQGWKKVDQGSSHPLTQIPDGNGGTRHARFAFGKSLQEAKLYQMTHDGFKFLVAEPAKH